MSSNTKIEHKFIINDNVLSYKNNEFPLKINSFPKSYEVDIIKDFLTYQNYCKKADFIIIDSNIYEIYKIHDLDQKKVLVIESKEENKNLSTVEKVLEKLIDLGISKGSLVIAIGGGIIQDIAACACALFRRGQPFFYFPTTTLGQLDSCVGAKCAINTSKAKNILGLFSAPSKVKIPIFMLRSMPKIEHVAGLSEMLRLCITGSYSAVKKYFQFLEEISDPANADMNTYIQAIRLSLSIKKSVVDFDEYERDVRRSMNYGHTFGHAIEKFLNYKLPHGIAILLGMHIANIYSNKIGILTKNDLEYLKEIFCKTISNIKLEFNCIEDIKAREIIDLFKYDKKGDGESVPLVLLVKSGEIIFKKYKFSTINKELENSIILAKKEFNQWINP